MNVSKKVIICDTPAKKSRSGKLKRKLGSRSLLKISEFQTATNLGG